MHYWILWGSPRLWSFLQRVRGLEVPSPPPSLLNSWTLSPFVCFFFSEVQTVQTVHICSILKAFQQSPMIWICYVHLCPNSCLSLWCQKNKPNFRLKCTSTSSTLYCLRPMCFDTSWQVCYSRIAWPHWNATVKCIAGDGSERSLGSVATRGSVGCHNVMTWNQWQFFFLNFGSWQGQQILHIARVQNCR